MPFPSSIDKVLEGSLGLNQYGINLLRSVEWGRKYLWSFQYLDDEGPGNFPEPTGARIPQDPFGDFFPAVDIDIVEAGLNTTTEETYIGPFEFPLSPELETLRLTFFDDQDNTLYRFHRDWIKNRIQGNKRHILPLLECVRAVELRKLKLASLADMATGLGADLGIVDEPTSGTISEVTSYWVIPKGNIPYNANSQSEAQLYSMDFIIAGVRRDDNKDNGLSDAIGQIAQSLGSNALTSGLGNIF